MRLVLFVSYEGDCECAGNTEVLPIEYSDKETAIKELNALLSEQRELQEVYTAKYREWHDQRPKIAPQRPYNGSNRRTLLKRAKQGKVDATLKEKWQAWMANQPPLPPTKITFCDNDLWVHGLDHTEILTLDEWYGTK